MPELLDLAGLSGVIISFSSTTVFAVGVGDRVAADAAADRFGQRPLDFLALVEDALGDALGRAAVVHRDDDVPAVVDGDTKSAAIAAASIVAKVTRDRLMRRLDALYPAYGFAQHVGYITPGHSAVVRERGPSAVHRLCFQALCYR